MDELKNLQEAAESKLNSTEEQLEVQAEVNPTSAPVEAPEPTEETPAQEASTAEPAEEAPETHPEVPEPAQTQEAAPESAETQEAPTEACETSAEENVQEETAQTEEEAQQAEPEAPQEAETPQAEPEAPQEEAETPQEETVEKPAPTTKAEVIERMTEILEQGKSIDRTAVEQFKALYYHFHNAEVAKAREQFIAEGGVPEEFNPLPDSTEETFREIFRKLREYRAKLAEQSESEKQNNLKRKQAIIDRIKELAASPETADKGYDEVKKLQAEWREIKLVPSENAGDLWKNYQLYVEQFYDQLRLNHEMRAYDFKKNLEIKTRLCEAAEKLAEVEDPVSAFHQLQKLHAEYREAGPVAKDQREEVWQRFKTASTVVNKRHQAHFDQLKAQEEANLRLKTELCEKLEALNFENARTYAQWDKLTNQVTTWQADWKSIGFTPRKVNSEIFARFRAGCDHFFQAKKAFFHTLRETSATNLAKKQELVDKAEALKESTDWTTTANTLIGLQKEWKATGPVNGKMNEVLWKRFNGACNYFFEKKNEATSSVRKEEEANLKLKREILEELKKLLDEPGDDLRQSVRELQDRWNAVGHVPFRRKEALFRQYKEVCDQLYGTIHETYGRRRSENYTRSSYNRGGNEVFRGQNRLQAAYEAKRQEIQNYETNLTFINANSTKGNSLVAEIEKKIESLKAEAEELKGKLLEAQENETND